MSSRHHVLARSTQHDRIKSVPAAVVEHRAPPNLLDRQVPPTRLGDRKYHADPSVPGEIVRFDIGWDSVECSATQKCVKRNPTTQRRKKHVRPARDAFARFQRFALPTRERTQTRGCTRIRKRWGLEYGLSKSSQSPAHADHCAGAHEVLNSPQAPSALDDLRAHGARRRPP